VAQASPSIGLKSLYFKMNLSNLISSLVVLKLPSSFNLSATKTAPVNVSSSLASLVFSIPSEAS
jgi:hypothetical protein